MATKSRKYKAKTSWLAQEQLETKRNKRASGIMPNAAYEKINKRHLGEKFTAPVAVKLSPEEIRALRVGARLSQAMCAHFLNLTVGYVSQLEPVEKRASGAAPAFLTAIKRRGIHAILL